jgi:Tetratricopeptide repeat
MDEDMLNVDDSLPKPVVKVAWLFAPEDDVLQRELEIHLSLLKREGQVSTWSERDMVPGTPLQEIERSLFSADLVVPLVSAHFIDQFHERISLIWSWYQDGQVRIVPIIAGPCGYHHTFFGGLTTLPTGGKPLTEWRNRQAAYANVEQGVRRVVELVLAQKWVATGALYCEKQCYEQGLQAFAQALKHDGQNSSVYRHKGDALYGMMKYKEAIEAYEHAIKLDPRSGPTWAGLYKALKARGKQVQEYYEQRAEEAEKQAKKLEHENGGEQDER